MVSIMEKIGKWGEGGPIFIIKEKCNYSIFLNETDTFPKREFFRQVDDGFPPERLSQFLVEWDQTVP